MNRSDTPDVLQQLQSGRAPQGLAAPVQHGTPVNRSTMTVTAVDLNRDGIPDVVQQSQCGIPSMGFAALVQYGAPANMRRPASGPARCGWR